MRLRVVGPDDAVTATADLPRQTPASVADALSSFLATAPPFGAVGHRVVHGGADFQVPLVLVEGMEADLDRLGDLAPQHNPPAIEAVRALRRLRPALPQVACFDTAFHACLPAAAATYALPHQWNTEWQLRRYGFHGLSHAYASRRAAALLGRPPADLRLVTAHLGSGASLAAVAGGRSVDTTMGFTPLAGLMMATRAGDVDPGLLLWLVRSGKLSAAEVEEALETGSGLLGLSGVVGRPAPRPRRSRCRRRPSRAGLRRVPAPAAGRGGGDGRGDGRAGRCGVHGWGRGELGPAAP